VSEAAGVEDLRECAEEIRAIAEEARGRTPALEAALRAAADAVAVGNEARATIAVVGESPGARRALLNGLLGAEVLPPAPARAAADQRLTWIRRAPDCEYTAHSRDGRRVVRFSQRMPDRRELFERQLARAQEEAAAARAEADERRARLETTRAEVRERQAAVDAARAELEAAARDETAARGALAVAEQRAHRADAARAEVPVAPALLVSAPAWWAVWLWIVRLLLRPLWRGRLRLRAARESDAARAREEVGSHGAEVVRAADRHRALEERHRAEAEELHARREAAAALEKEVADTRAVERGAERVGRLIEERDEHARERHEAFLADLRAMGEGIAELTVEYPAERLPEGLTLLDVPGAWASGANRTAAASALGEAHGFVLVAEGDRPPGAAAAASVDILARGAPRLLLVRARADRLVDPAAVVAGAFQRIHARRAVVVRASAAMRLRSCLDALSTAREAAVESHRRRLAALEGQRIPDPREVRAQQMERAHATIEQAADEAVASAGERLRASIADQRRDWAEQVAACTDRGSLRAVLERLDTGAPARIGEILEQTTDHVARELQTTTESIEAWAVEEIQARYRLARRIDAESLTPLASDLTREDLELGARSAPVEAALAAFEKQRVGLGLGGAAAGAVLGTLIFPGIGTAIGAFVGVFAGFLKGIESLQQECMAKIDACLAEAESHALAQLRARRPELARALRETVDAALGEAFDRLEEAIARLKDVERRAIEAERSKLRVLDDARSALVRIELRLDRAVAAAERQLTEASPPLTAAPDPGTVPA